MGTDGQTDRHDEANRRFQEFCESVKYKAIACATWKCTIRLPISPRDGHV